MFGGGLVRVCCGGCGGCGGGCGSGGRASGGRVSLLCVVGNCCVRRMGVARLYTRRQAPPEAAISVFCMHRSRGRWLRSWAASSQQKGSRTTLCHIVNSQHGRSTRRYVAPCALIGPGSAAAPEPVGQVRPRRGPCLTGGRRAVFSASCVSGRPRCAMLAQRRPAPDLREVRGPRLSSKPGEGIDICAPPFLVLHTFRKPSALPRSPPWLDDSLAQCGPSVTDLVRR